MKSITIQNYFFVCYNVTLIQGNTINNTSIWSTTTTNYTTVVCSHFSGNGFMSLWLSKVVFISIIVSIIQNYWAFFLQLDHQWDESPDDQAHGGFTRTTLKGYSLWLDYTQLVCRLLSFKVESNLTNWLSVDPFVALATPPKPLYSRTSGSSTNLRCWLWATSFTL